MKQVRVGDQVDRIMNKLDLSGMKKVDQKKAGALGYRSTNTWNHRKADAGRAIKSIFAREGINWIKEVTPEMIFTEVRDQIDRGLSSSTIQGYTKVLSDIYEFLHGVPINYGGLVPSRSSDAPTGSRAFTADQVREIVLLQTSEFSLQTEIVQVTGLREVELNTIHRADELPAKIAEDRVSQLVPYRWEGREGVEYVVTGKGGLERIVHLPPELSQRLEAYRLDVPREIQVQRGEDGRTVQQHYDLPSAESWSRNFANVSKQLFGRKDGVHGLRHAFAQVRIAELQVLGYSHKEAMLGVSQSLGHFRASELNAYLR